MTTVSIGWFNVPLLSSNCDFANWYNFQVSGSPLWHGVSLRKCEKHPSTYYHSQSSCEEEIMMYTFRPDQSPKIVPFVREVYRHFSFIPDNNVFDKMLDIFSKDISDVPESIYYNTTSIWDAIIPHLTNWYYNENFFVAIMLSGSHIHITNTLMKICHQKQPNLHVYLL